MILIFAPWFTKYSFFSLTPGHAQWSNKFRYYLLFYCISWKEPQWLRQRFLGLLNHFCRSISEGDLAVNLSEILEKYIDQDHGQTILEIGIAVLAPKKMPRIFR